MRTFKYCLCPFVLFGATSVAWGAVPQKDDVLPHLKQRRPSAISSQEEHITVSSHVLPTGVSNMTPGGGMMPVQTAARGQSGITRDYIAKASPTATVISLVNKLPGVQGNMEGPISYNSENLYIRGMDQTQIGFLFEGAPISADPFSYIPWSSVSDNENIRSVTVTQGSSDNTAPLYNAVGGQVSTNLIAPSSQSGGFISAGGGSFGTHREFLRLESGSFAHDHLRGYVSVSHTKGNMWKGPGDAERYHVDARLDGHWGDLVDTSLILGYTHQKQTYWLQPTLAQFKQYGISYNLTKEYYPGNTNWYKYNFQQLNMIDLVSNTTFHINNNISIKATPYLVMEWGPNSYIQSIPSSGGYFGTQQYGNLGYSDTVGSNLTVQNKGPWRSNFGGLNLVGTWEKGNNKLSVGYWYSYTAHDEHNAFYPLSYTGVPASQPVTINGKVLTGYNPNAMQQVNMISISDELAFFSKKLKIGAAFRAAMVSRATTEDVPGADPYKGTGNYFEPLPQLWASYNFDSHNQIYLNGHTAFRTPSGILTYVQRYSPASATPIQLPSDPRPEYSISEEIGYRHTGFYNFSIALFNYNLTNYQLASSSYLPNSTVLITTQMNAGGRTARGIQAEFGLAPWHHFSPYFSGQFLHATTDNNFNTGADLLPTKGKVSVASPKFTAAIGLNYDDDRFFGNFALRYVDSQYTTLMNDQSIPSYVVADMTLGYRLKKIGFLKSPQIQLNMQNIGGNQYLSSPTGFTATSVTRKGIYGTTVSGSQPTYYYGSGFSALVSLSTGF